MGYLLIMTPVFIESAAVSILGISQGGLTGIMLIDGASYVCVVVGVGLLLMSAVFVSKRTLPSVAHG